ncbi:hypothetical protein [Aeromicrobium panaciterrae]|uniref:hypothetical protein n=1 Tax=Aeromicrobium panaciterrae TaxID=363861 RepID=UPI0031D72912
MSTPCADESANNCYWDAGTSGNGQGQSYVALATADTGPACIYFTARPQDDYCEDGAR